MERRSRTPTAKTDELGDLALTRLRAIVEGRDRRVALRALTLLDRHLSYPRTIKLTQALGMEDAALLHLDAIN